MGLYVFSNKSFCKFIYAGKTSVLYTEWVCVCVDQIYINIQKSECIWIVEPNIFREGKLLCNTNFTVFEKETYREFGCNVSQHLIYVPVIGDKFCFP